MAKRTKDSGQSFTLRDDEAEKLKVVVNNGDISKAEYIRLAVNKQVNIDIKKNGSVNTSHKKV